MSEFDWGSLDPDVAQWLRENAPRPVHGHNYHQRLSSQYGLKRSIEHIWKLVGVASACSTMDELRYKMKEIYGDKKPLQLQFPIYPPPT